MYAQAVYTESEFWDIYDEKFYLDLRKKYRAEYLPSAFDKACAIGNGTSQTGQPGWTEWATQKAWGIWPVSGVYGVLQTLVSKEYLLKK